MATSDRGSGLAGDDDRANRLHAAEFVTVSTSPTADAIAATAALVQLFQQQSVPFHVRLGAAPTVTVAEDAPSIAVGTSSQEADVHLAPPATTEVTEITERFGTEPDPVLSAVGRQVWEAEPTSDDGADSDQKRSPGVGLPVADVADGLTHSTLLRGPWSGDTDYREIPQDAENDADLASLVALEALQASAVPARTASALERALHPMTTAEHAFPTVEGLADVLTVLAAEDPGMALAVACEPATHREEAVQRWHRSAAAVHDRLSTGPDETGGDVAVYYDADPAPHVLARLARDFEGEAACVLALSAETVAVATCDPSRIDRLVEHGCEPVAAWYRPGRCLLRGDHTGTPTDLADTLQEVLA